MRYRPEIDGLRAIAVVPVILFHANVGIMPGGFVGVDVFFVISGYLITRILLDDLSAGRFSIVNFYERRMRRIAPALFFVCLACLPFAAMWMLPPELRAFGKSLFHALLMVSNFELWDDVSYFSAKNELKPLLHTWSLSVEEQFYLVFPVLLWALRRCQRRTIFCVVAALAALSFALTLPISRIDPVANFYLPFTRFWELSVGALLAIGGVRTIEIADRMKAALASAGLAGIVLACLFLTSTDGYPGLATLLPCIGTVLVLAYASPANLVGRVLALPLFVGIGLISYSLYLWHQPVFAFARLRGMDMLPGWSYAPLIALTFLLAVFSYFCVERPFRRSRRIAAGHVFAFTGAGAATLILLGIVIKVADGFPGRDPGLQAIRQPGIGISDACNGHVRPSECATSAEPEMAIWGDSFAMHLVDGVLASMPGDGSIVQLNMGKCAFPSGIAPALPDMARLWPLDCMRHNEEAVKAYLAATPSLRYVVLASQYLTYLSGNDLMTSGGEVIPTDFDRVLREVEATAEWVRSIGLKPVFMAPPPRDGRDIGLCVARTRLFGMSNAMCAMSRDDQRAHDAIVSRLVSDISKRFPVVSMEDFLCDDDRCRVLDEDTAIYRDDGHFSKRGSIHLGERLGFYQTFAAAAEKGCRPRAALPSGTCQMTPVDGKARSRSAGGDASAAIDPG
jgi:peptidoglycan/LPS O-acetylase OafA/YrhL